MTERMIEELEMVINEEWTVIGMAEGISDDEIDAVLNEILEM